MKCPVCNDVNLVMSERSGIEIDYCPQCRGVWLDRGELDKIIERSEPAAAPPPRQGGHGDRYHGDDRYKHKRRKSLLAELFD